MKLWIEILPDDWYSWDDRPSSVKIGRVRKVAPKHVETKGVWIVHHLDWDECRNLFDLRLP